MDRWTIERLNSLSNIDFAIAILNERRSSLTNYYSPLSQKLGETILALTELRNQIKPNKPTR